MTLATLFPKGEGIGFSLTAQSYGECKVGVELSNSVSSAEWEKIFNSRMFQDWLSVYASSDHLRLMRLVIEQVQHAGKAADDKLLAFTMHVEAQDKDGEVFSGQVCLRPLRRAVLVLLRNTETRTDTCVFVRKPNLSVGLTETLELPEGEFDAETGKFVGPAAEELEKQLETPIFEKDLVNLTQVTFGGGGIALGRELHAPAFAPGVGAKKNAKAKDGNDKKEGVVVPLSGGERVELYLHRANLSPEAMNAIEGKIGRMRRRGKVAASIVFAPDAENVTKHDKLNDSAVKLSLVQLGDAWGLAADALAVSALFLVHELRYHRLMPKYRNPLADAAGAEGKAAPVVKAAATFKRVEDLGPTSKGLNVRVKVVKPKVVDRDHTFHSGRTSREGHMVVGDDSAIITLKLVDQQLDLPDAEGTPLLIRNGLISMENGHMKLVVDRWGKIISDIPETEKASFNFTVDSSRDMTATEYELVVLNEEGEGDSMPPPGRGGRGRGGRGRGGRGRRGGLARGRR
ncbi:nuclear factor NF7 [Besnoitia besnoiti]|uniref:Nuclear factor NF7 n=1 Tax=Besnoitia besnoiti TaxID=94643 RepID=A0A2A9MJN7_BESBE|nr:nuclear factor NF7 [Besnoitia besnoiti]PFH38129.1 nuclear factor NF7 [Besnoitia besnoiti]